LQAKMELCRIKAKKIAERFKGYKPESIPSATKETLEKIPFTLLSSSQIETVVKETGAISPFYSQPKTGEKPRLKLAAYEGRIGSQAFHFEKDSAPVCIFSRETDAFLTIPKNSIVFVECDLDFRLPEFVGARFNLQIVHVHRGLLLGTGPLVDPGFWGKLCIPIHNLTSEDYRIPKDEGLIWLEFTRTTAPITGDPSGVAPLGGKQFWDITKYLDKAQKQFDLFPERPKVPISSSLPIMFDDATKASRQAKIAAEKSQKESEKSASWAKNLTLGGGLGLFVAAVAVLTLIISILSWTTTIKVTLDELKPRVDKIEHDFEIHRQTIQTSAETDGEVRDLLINLIDRSAESLAKIAELEARVSAQNIENEKFQVEQQRLQSRLVDLKSQIEESSTPIQPQP
jgi:deoxycytidine triphosphate deaminase/cell division protein FtsL